MPIEYPLTKNVPHKSFPIIVVGKQLRRHWRAVFMIIGKF